MAAAAISACIPGFAWAQDAPLDRLSAAFSTPICYRAEYELAAPMLDPEADKRLRSLKGEVAARYIEDKGRSLLVSFVGSVTVRDPWTMRKEQHSPLLGGRAERSSSIDIHTPTYEGHANRANPSRATARNVRTLTVQEQADAIARRIYPFEFQRADDNYLFLGTYLAERLRGAPDLKVQSLDGGRTVLSSEALAVSATIDSATGQLVGATLGSDTLRSIISYEFDEFFEQKLFPARHPGVARQFVTRYKGGKALPPQAGLVVRYLKVETCPPPPAEEFDIRTCGEQVYDEATGKLWQPPANPDAPQVTPTSFMREPAREEQAVSDGSTK